MKWLVLLIALLPGTAKAACFDTVAFPVHTKIGTIGPKLPQDCAIGRYTADCRWSFDFRSDAALEFWSHLQTSLRNCAVSQPGLDRPVNHPDSYFHESFDTYRGQVAIRMKDKTADGKTFIFVGFFVAR